MFFSCHTHRECAGVTTRRRYSAQGQPNATCAPAAMSQGVNEHVRCPSRHDGPRMNPDVTVQYELKAILRLWLARCATRSEEAKCLTWRSRRPAPSSVTSVSHGADFCSWRVIHLPGVHAGARAAGPKRGGPKSNRSTAQVSRHSGGIAAWSQLAEGPPGRYGLRREFEEIRESA